MPSPPMLQPCAVRGCGSLTLAGGTCVAHDPPPRAYPRGRPHLAGALLATPRLAVSPLELALASEREALLR